MLSQGFLQSMRLTPPSKEIWTLNGTWLDAERALIF